MQLTEGSIKFLEQILKMAPKGDRQELAAAIAADLVSSVKPVALARALFTRDKATELLTSELVSNPEVLYKLGIKGTGTKAACSSDGSRGLHSSNGSNGCSNHHAAHAAAKAANKQPKLSRKPSLELSLKELILHYVQAHPGVGRRAILEHSSTRYRKPSAAQYTHAMHSLVEEHKIRVKGSKRAAVYFAK